MPGAIRLRGILTLLTHLGAQCSKEKRSSAGSKYILGVRLALPRPKIFVGSSFRAFPCRVW
jgi:hypothetical protein